MYHQVNQRKEQNSEFNVMMDIMNVGYRSLDHVSLIQLKPHIVDEDYNGVVAFSIDTMVIDEHGRTPVMDIDLGWMESGKRIKVMMNITVEEKVSYPFKL